MNPHLRGHLLLPLTLITFGLLLYLPFRSISLDDFDSYSFALALKDYSLELQQPQPPGFPVYIALARALYSLRQDEVWALTVLSGLCGVVSIWLVYKMGRLLDPRHPFTALVAALFFAVTPVSWLTGGKALSDMPGLAWLLLSLWLWLRWRSAPSRQALTHAAIASGLSLGVRPQNALPLVLLVVAYMIEDLTGRPTAKGGRPWGIWLQAIGVGLIGVLLWLIPTALLSGGLGTYLALIEAHAAHVGQTDALVGMDAPLGQALRIRLIAFADVGLTGLTGTGLYPQGDGSSWQTQPFWRALVWGLALFSGLAMAGWRRRQTRWLSFWWLAVALQILLFETLDRPRLLLPLLPPLVLLVAMGWSRIVRHRELRAALLGASFLAGTLQALPLVTQLSRVPAPPAQATAYIADHYAAHQTLVAAAGSFRAVQLELPQYDLIYLYTFEPEQVTAALAAEPTYVAILDRDQFTPEALAVLSGGDRLVTLEDRLFKRDRRVHTQHDQVRLQVLAPPELIPLEALTLPADGCVDLGGERDGRYLGQGWYRTEEIAGTPARWAGGVPTATLRLVLPSGPDRVLRFRALGYPPQQAVTVRIGDVGLGEVALTEGWSEAQVSLPQDVATKQTAVVIELVHNAIRSPFEVSEGASSDRRLLAAAYDWVCVGPSSDSP